jgi:hypothetical protein
VATKGTSERCRIATSVAGWDNVKRRSIHRRPPVRRTDVRTEYVSGAVWASGAAADVSAPCAAPPPTEPVPPDVAGDESDGDVVVDGVVVVDGDVVVGVGSDTVGIVGTVGAGSVGHTGGSKQSSDGVAESAELPATRTPAPRRPAKALIFTALRGRGISRRRDGMRVGRNISRDEEGRLAHCSSVTRRLLSTPQSRRPLKDPPLT